MQMITRWMIGALVLGLGCGGAQIEPPGGDSEPQGSSGAATTTGTPDTTGAASVTEAGTTTEVGTTAPTTGEGTTTDTGGENCVGPDGCFNCAPKQPLEVLNACSDAACSPFENTQKRLPLLKDDGTLPPLP